MTTLSRFRLSITSDGPIGSVAPTPLDEHVVLDFSGNTHNSPGPYRGAFAYDRDSGELISTGLRLPISTGGARSSATFTQLNYYWLKHVPASTTSGSEFTDVGGKARAAKRITKKRIPAKSEKLTLSGPAALAKLLSKPISAQTLFWGIILQIMITLLEFKI